ncbi:M24 family metallopeptidase [Halobium palmae]|uniref:M24 family metallopeptidase n=1 Tax=Halobium palmae TaxID=1776492 RepID=A0ABD5S095_9EURY
MPIGPLDDETVEKYREAGEALRTVFDETAEMIEPGVSQLEVAEYAESRIEELADGNAFPANISVDEEASHATPLRDDDTEFGEEMVCLDLGTHVDGYIADAALTVDLTGNDEGDVVAIEPFATTGSGKVTEGATEEIYAVVEERSVRDRSARQVLEQAEAEFQGLPFAARWLDSSRSEMALRRLTQNGILRGYPVLKEDDGELVSQAEHTVVVTEDGCEVTTA